MERDNSYTEYLQNEAYSISPDDDDYTARLEAVAAYFRTPGELISTFIAENGFLGKINATLMCLMFLKSLLGFQHTAGRSQENTNASCQLQHVA